MTPPLTVGIDARKIRDFGIGRFLEGLLTGLAESPGDERFVLFLPTDPARALPEELDAALSADRFPRVPCDAALYSAREQFAFLGAARKHALDVLHFPHYVRTLPPGCPVVVSIHDAIHLSHPPSAFAFVYACLMMPWSGLTARRLLTGTAAARDDICRRFPMIRPHRFAVTPYGLDLRFRPPSPETIERFRTERDLTRPYVLCIGSHRPHKNLPAAVQAFHEAELGEADLVVPTRDAASERELSRIVHGPGVRLLPGVNDEEMPSLYAAARVVMCPSLAEGFGFAPLEAAGSGAAVIATDIPAHREVMADAARLVPAPYETADLTAALADLWADSAARELLARRGADRAAQFTWRRTADLTRRVYHQAAGRLPRSAGSLL